MAILALILLAVLTFVFNTVVSMQLISWFVIPIGFAHAAGLNLLISYYSMREGLAKDKSADGFIGRVLGRLGIGVIALIIGYALKSFM